MIFSETITKIAMKILGWFSRKEGEAERVPYESESCFTVHSPKWLVPLIIVYELFFGGFAVFSYLNDIIIAMWAFIAFCLLGFFALALDGTFRIRVDGSQIEVCRLFRGTQFFQGSQIISCCMDNAGAVTVSFGTETVGIDPSMVNREAFMRYAEGWAWRNTDTHQRQVYRIRREKREFIILILSLVVISAGTAFIVPPLFKSPDLSPAKIALACAGVGIFVLWLFAYLVSLALGALTVDEVHHTISYRSGFSKTTEDISRIIRMQSRKRFLEEHAMNYTLWIERDRKKPLKKRFTSLNDNADRLVYLLLKEWKAVEEDDENE